MKPQVSSTNVTSVQPQTSTVKAKPEIMPQTKSIAEESKRNANPYILNKKSGEHTGNTKSVADRTALHWTKPGALVAYRSGDSKSHSDSELYTKRTEKNKSATLSGMSSLERFPKQTLTRTSYTWNKSQLMNSGTSSALNKTRFVKESEWSVSNQRWATAARTSMVNNPYVLKRQTRKTQKKAAVATNSMSKSPARGLPSKVK